MANMNLRSPVYQRRHHDDGRLSAAIDRITAAGWTTAEAAALLEAAVDWEPADAAERAGIMRTLSNRLRRMLTIDRIAPSRLLSRLYGMEAGTHSPFKLTRLPPEARAELDRMAAAGATGDAIATRMAELGAPVSSQTAGRYKKRHLARLERHQEAHAVAGAWVGALMGASPGTSGGVGSGVPAGDRAGVGRLLQEMLKTVAFQTLAAVGGEEEEVPDAKQLAVLAKAVREVATAEQITTELELRLRRELAESLAPKLAAAERAAHGRPADLKAALARIREEVYGLAPDARTDP